MQQRDALSLHRRHAVELQPVGGDLQCAVRHIHPDDPGELSLAEQESQQPALPAAKVQHGGRAAGAQRAEHRSETLLVQAERTLERPLLGIARRGARRFIFRLLLGD